ncbi:hypothetical protein Lalb_Chr20g0113721 [Lupinus albus]|uniref:Uncharacterized protein n=1 Tax=Lupinus albus TaxID=3870 RepID=A0A6A4NWG4_LUPAL|nr:hypothetical protein Lalb_Chr20g0113721 [Lupinus albus]
MYFVNEICTRIINPSCHPVKARRGLGNTHILYLYIDSCQSDPVVTCLSRLRHKMCLYG